MHKNGCLVILDAPRIIQTTGSVSDLIQIGHRTLGMLSQTREFYRWDRGLHFINVTSLMFTLFPSVSLLFSRTFAYSLHRRANEMG